jgi:threonine dehydratase
MGERNFKHVLQFVDGIVTVTEDEIRETLRIVLRATNLVAEPSGAVALAAAMFHANELPPARRVVAIVSGGNLDPGLRAELEQETVAVHA